MTVFTQAPEAIVPSIVSVTATPGTRTNAVTVQGFIAYVSDFGSGPGTFGINAYDISRPEAPVLIARFNDTTPPAVNNTYRMRVAGQYLYVAVNSRVMIYDVSNPAAPVRTALVGAGSQQFDIAVEGSLLALSDTGGATRFFDASNPNAPVPLGSIAPGAAFVELRGRYAYSTAFASQTLNVIDISDPTTPVIVGSVNVGPGSLALDVQLEYGRAYVAVEGAPSRIVIVDIRDPANPSVLGSFEHSLGGNTNDIAAMGRFVAAGDTLSGGSGIVSFYDVLDPTNVSLVASIDVGASAESLRPWGPYLLVTDRVGNNFVILQVATIFPRIQGGHVEQLSAGELDVLGEASVGDGLRVGTSVNVGRDVYAGERVSARKSLNLASPTVPTTSTDPGRTGDMAWDSEYLYWCVAPNSWVRTPNPATTF